MVFVLPQLMAMVLVHKASEEVALDRWGTRKAYLRKWVFARRTTWITRRTLWCARARKEVKGVNEKSPVLQNNESGQNMLLIDSTLNLSNTTLHQPKL